MRRRLSLVITAIMTLSLLFTSIIPLAATSDNANIPVRKIVVFQEQVSQAAQDAILAKAGAGKIKSLPLSGAAVVMATPAAEKALSKFAEVLYIEDDVIATIMVKPEKPGKPGGEDPPTPLAQITPWGIDRIDASLAWNTSTGSGVKVAVLDTGIDLTHPDLNVAGSYNAINSRKSANDDNGHGTHVAGTIGANNNDFGVVGVAPGVTLYAVKVLDRSGSGWVSDIIEGIEWCMVNDIQVINMSLGSASESTIFHKTVTDAYEAGIIIVAAAGNDGDGLNQPEYPAAWPEVIAVSATDKSDGLAYFSTFGSQIELAAPGFAIESTYKGGGYATMYGTSMATPHVTGVVALVIASATVTDTADDDDSTINNEVRSKLQSTADDLTDDNQDKDVYFGYGLVDAEEAVTGTGP
ncbi:S8 family peptidase [Dehalogenimonas sp. THU2]|uniref:S8 family peptidase n=1 Tax=Dehalogenimonas sp. THU2 TaxID=3151121 RepID=UPI0032184E90